MFIENPRLLWINDSRSRGFFMPLSLHCRRLKLLVVLCWNTVFWIICCDVWKNMLKFSLKYQHVLEKICTKNKKTSRCFPEHISMFFLKDADILFHLCPLPVNTLQLPLRHQEKIRLLLVIPWKRLTLLFNKSLKTSHNERVFEIHLRHRLRSDSDGSSLHNIRYYQSCRNGCFNFRNRNYSERPFGIRTRTER